MNKFINNPNEQLLNIKCKQLLHKNFILVLTNKKSQRNLTLEVSNLPK